MHPGVKKYLLQTITRYPVTGLSKSGQPTYGSTTTISCLIQRKELTIRDTLGEDVQSSTQIIIDGNETINHDDKIVLPDGRSPYIITVETVVDFTGQPYYKMIYT